MAAESKKNQIYDTPQSKAFRASIEGVRAGEGYGDTGEGKVLILWYDLPSGAYKIDRLALHWTINVLKYHKLHLNN